MIGAQAKILNEIANPRIRRNDIALSYAACMRERDSVDWRKINTAIAARWSPAGLSYIKTLAWKHMTDPESQGGGDDDVRQEARRG